MTTCTSNVEGSAASTASRTGDAYEAYGQMDDGQGLTSLSAKLTSLQNLRDRPHDVTGLQKLHDRLYDAGRFTHSDRYEGSNSDPASLHKYVYTHENPINGVDPSGELNLAEITIGQAVGAVLTYLLVRAVPFGLLKMAYNNLIADEVPVLAPSQIDPEDKVYAALAEDVYTEQSPGASGWLSQGADFARDLTGFQARLYRNGESYVLAFAGTDSIFNRDMVANVMQGAFGTVGTTQYWDAVEAAEEAKRIVKRRNPGATLELTGHSLGGGLASAAALATDLHAVTFNAAGLNFITTWSLGKLGMSDATVRAYHVRGEILTTLQTNTGMPSAYGTEFYALEPVGDDGLDGAFKLHGIDYVKRAMGMLA